MLVLLVPFLGLTKSHYFYYETISIPPGLSTLGMTVDSHPRMDYLFKSNNLPDGFTVFKPIETSGGPSWTVYYYDAFFGEWNIQASDTNALIARGQAVYVYNPASTPFQQVIIGNLAQRATTRIQSGFNFIASSTLKKGGISSVHGLSPNDGDQVYKRVGDSWSIHTFEDGEEPKWIPAEPSLQPFEGFWYKNQNHTAFDWMQSDMLPNSYNSNERRFNLAVQLYDPAVIDSIYCFATKLNTESMITFSYSTNLANPAWFVFNSYGPGFQPNDETYTGVWLARSSASYGFIRVSTW